MEKDFYLMCSNAQTYNEEESVLYKDSVTLFQVFRQAKVEAESELLSKDEGTGDKSSGKEN